MKRIRRNVTPAMRAANRANSSHSTGPRTERGKQVSRLNAAKHWGRAEGMRDLMPALGEDPAEFQAMREGLYRSLGPRDEFEAMLVDDMADIRWRLRRMIRAETAHQAKHRRSEMQRRDERAASGENGGSLQLLELTFVSKVGFANLSDSPAKFYRVIEILKAFTLMVREEAVDSEGRAYLEGVYGPHPSAAAQGLMVRFESYLKARQSDDETERAASRQALLEDLEAEIAWFEKRAAADRQARAELAAPRVEAQMLCNHLNLERSMLYQERLERRFDKKWKMLLRYRRLREAEATDEDDLFVDDTATEAVPGAPPRRDAASEKQNEKMHEQSRQPVENTRSSISETAPVRQHAENTRVRLKPRQLVDKSTHSYGSPETQSGVEAQGEILRTGPADKKGGST